MGECIMPRPTPQQLKQLKKTLEAERMALLADAQREITRWGEHPIGELAGEVPDVGDESVATMVTDLDHAILERHVDALRDIDAALARMGDRSYGICVDCEDDIEPRRLAAFPMAKRCIDCQSLYERTYARRATPTL
jgi:DnaK suppressor protein